MGRGRQEGVFAIIKPAILNPLISINAQKKIQLQIKMEAKRKRNSIQNFHGHVLISQDDKIDFALISKPSANCRNTKRVEYEWVEKLTVSETACQ